MEVLFMRMLRIIVLTVFCGCLTACSAAQDSAGKAFDNAGSVIRSGSKKMYIKEDEKSATTDRSKEEEEGEFQRY